MNKYFASCRDCEQIAFDLDKETSHSKKEKILQKLLCIKKEIDTNFLLYAQAIESFNSTSQKFVKSIEKVVEAYNFYEEKRSKCFEECLSYLNSILGESSSFFKEFLLEDIRLPLEVYHVSIFTIQDLVVENYEGVHPLFTGIGTSMPNLHYSLLESSGASQGTSKVVEELYKNEIGDIVTKAWKGQELTRDDYVTFNSRLKEPQGRKAWAWSMNLRRSQGEFKLSDGGFNKIGELMLAALNECERTQDIYIAKNCIILSQTFYRETRDKKKVYLQTCILSHSLWKNMEFWEDVVNTAICEELKKQGNPAEAGDEAAMLHEKNLVFCQLVSFGHIMLSFKMQTRTVQELINKYAKKYSLLKDETDNIMQAVSDSLDSKD